MRRFVFSALAGIYALGSLVIAPPASAQAGTFEILLNGERIGTATCNFTATAEGYNSTSIVRVSMQGLDYSLSKTEQLSSSNELQNVLLSGVVNGEAVNITAAPDSGQLVLAISANGRKTTSRLAAHPGAVILPDFDPGALETLLALAVKRNNRDLWAIFPKKSGSIEPVQLATYADDQGTLDGNPITAHHLVATIAGAKIDLFSGPGNRLLQAELPQQGFALVRNGFVLKPSARAAAPPAQ
ncbi:MAG TPA: hypothetical protein VGS10_11185 [Terracidiphilus sp.]|nr:hypothetical protein [Terracidiphilus sp.]